ncbi:enoyl-CoA hydratase-related protein [Haloarcula sp. H-GB4]|uniref:enoyl-CoA hydratase/isomerase family protein n=1 Tax=Haloarcula sp. H-GB4 TaxID=3069755 RepID=UPI0027B7968A|nr:enoyl-CoA hydratase-related protein [Haloarcula sp. H-GB4]MDQ2074519.1 enoyl-CoA hydratase-related protein [Haloarcula sp. H-GB4]
MSEFDEYETVAVEFGTIAKHVATLTISRPNARNALNGTVRSEVKMAIDALEETERDVRVLVITGDDDGGAFVAGADISEFRDRDQFDQREASTQPRIYERVADFPLPVIAAINGHALGGGCELSLACDIRVAKEGAKLGQPEIGLGLIPGGGGTQRLPQVVGMGQAMKLILSGELVDATEAEEIGLVEETHPEGEFEARLSELARTIAEKSPKALEHGKRALSASAEMNLDAGLDYELELFTSLFATKDMREGIEAFYEDRDPEFTGE